MCYSISVLIAGAVEEFYLYDDVLAEDVHQVRDHFTELVEQYENEPLTEDLEIVLYDMVYGSTIDEYRRFE